MRDSHKNNPNTTTPPPCVRARLTLEGWYVRFMVNPDV
jgi:hypothetical protein